MVNRFAIHQRARRLLPEWLGTTCLAVLPLQLDALKGDASPLPMAARRVIFRLAPELQAMLLQVGRDALDLHQSGAPGRAYPAPAGRGPWRARWLPGGDIAYVSQSAHTLLWILPDRGLVIHCERVSRTAPLAGLVKCVDESRCFLQGAARHRHCSLY